MNIHSELQVDLVTDTRSFSLRSPVITSHIIMKIHSDLPVFSQLRTPGQSALRTPGKFFSCKKSFPDTRLRVRVSGTDSAKCLSPFILL